LLDLVVLRKQRLDLVSIMYGVALAVDQQLSIVIESDLGRYWAFLLLLLLVNWH